VFIAKFEEYQKNPLMTKRRMFFEAMEGLLPGMKVVIDPGDGATQRILPLESFVGGSSSASNAGGGSAGTYEEGYQEGLARAYADIAAAASGNGESNGSATGSATDSGAGSGGFYETEGGWR